MRSQPPDRLDGAHRADAEKYRLIPAKIPHGMWQEVFQPARCRGYNKFLWSELKWCWSRGRQFGWLQRKPSKISLTRIWISNRRAARPSSRRPDPPLDHASSEISYKRKAKYGHLSCMRGRHRRGRGGCG